MRVSNQLKILLNILIKLSFVKRPRLREDGFYCRLVYAQTAFIHHQAV